ncbi:non-ribosomal peptide synthetase [Agrococcus baldri]|uniref:Non-ribosomal peptide synthetase n=1 Tax=Agrococcus baldri TaxID=153730 RepID=A0AA87RCJ8_9MICO|nr:non-ribosomal peptide synthetase [Agrococcus baldri]GEK80346.1 non-ribosomal peptide synthetase [Agrococcus baldri]
MTTAPQDTARTTDRERIPLTDAQRGIWYAQQLDADNPTYQIGQQLHLLGPLEPAILRVALTKTVADLDALSLRFRDDPDGPYAVLARPRPADDLLEVVDLRHLDRAEAEALARARVEAEMATPRDLQGDELFGAILFRFADDRATFFQRVHHIVLDGYSAVIALRYLAALHTRLARRIPRRLQRLAAAPLARIAARIPSPLPSLAELRGSIEEYEGSPQRAADEAHWRMVLAEDAPVVGLEGSTGAVARRVVRASAVLGEARAARLAALERDLPKTVVGVLALYLSKITGERRVSLGLPVTARRGRVAKTTPSMLSSILPLRIDVDPAASVDAVIAHAGEVVRGAVRAQRFRVERIEGAPAHAGPSVNLLPVIDAIRFGAAEGEIEILSTGPVHDLSVVVSGLYSDAADARVQLEGDADAHSVETLREHLGRMLALIDEALEDGSAAVVDARVVDDSEAAAMLALGEGGRERLATETILDAFAVAARERAAATAVVAADGELTFAELDAQATRLAHHLVAQGVGAGARVAVRIERSRLLPMLVLAVLRSGGAYVPLDPEYPSGRVAGMIEDAAPLLLLTSTGQLERDRAAGARWSVPTLAVDADTCTWQRATSDPAALPRRASDDLAYVVFTSGSTGRPKGVGVDGVALRNLFQHHREHLFAPAAERLGRPLRVAHTAGLSFDAAWDPLLWLFAGHELHMIDDDTRRDPERLVAHLQSRGIDAIETTPSFAEALLAAGLLEAEPHPSEIALGGEAVGPALWDALAARDDLRAVNLYGPTETTVDSLVAEIVQGAQPHIGSSVRNSRHYILDASLTPVPARAVGELYLAGTNVARGYIGQPGLTAESFVADPFADDGSRMYRTGDVVRRRRDGSLRFIGRIDDQVKIRGYRVELAEVEAAMRRERGVARAAVVVHGEGAAARIVGYVSGTGTAAGLGAAVRESLRTSLPEYMVPSTVIALDEMPMTANGKLDRRALPTPERSAADPAQRPRSRTERIVVEAFAEVLGVDGVGVDEDFFAAGGHSLLATRLAALLSERLETRVSVRDVFEHPTGTALAARVGEAGGGERRPRLERTPRPDPLPVSLAQRRLWFLNRLEPDSAAYNIPIVLHLDGALDEAALREALRDVARRHEPLRTIVPLVDGEPVQRVLEGDAALPELVAVDVPADRLEAVVRDEAARPFDVTTEAPLRAMLLRTGGAQHVLVATMHHIAGDGWSLAPFARDLGDAYRARAAGAQPEPAPLPVDYADFALWQREHLGDPDDASSELAAQLAHWRAALADAPEEIALPRDRARGTADPQDPAHTGVGEVRLELDAPRHAALRALAAEHRTSLFIVLHAAVVAMLEQQGAGDDIVLGTPVAGRTDPQLDELVGFFVNTVVLRTSVAGDPTLEELLERVRTSNTEAYAHQDVPFDAVVDAMRPDRVADRHPLFQVLLTLQSTEPAALDLGDVRVRVPAQTTSAGVKADLLIDVATPEGESGALVASLGFDRALFDESTVVRMRDALGRVLDALLAAPHRRVSDIPSVDAETAAWLERVAAGRALPAAGTVLDALRATAERMPAADAIVDESGTLSFAQLVDRVDALAAGMAARGVERGARVAVALPRIADAVVVVLAALRAGAVAVPIDIAYPDARIARILEGAHAELVVGLDAARLRAIAAGLGAGVNAGAAVVDPVDLIDRAAAVPTGPKPDDAAYLVYTSGTTGAPKGVQVSHAALANVLAQHEDAMIAQVRDRVAGSPRMLHLSGLGFDAAWDPILWLAAGTALEIADEATRIDGEAVVRAIVERGIDVVETTPSYAQQLVAVGLLEAVGERGSALTLALGGEAVPQRLWDRLAVADGIDAWNLYGPSESTVDAVVARIAAPGRVVIGAPVANTSARVLDRFLQPVPPGVEGELYLSGASLAHGYRGRAAETADRFVADPHGDGTRMYRTGDIVRRAADGSLEFLRRDDDQVKLRGYRIEMGDVERALESAPGVGAAVVRVIAPGGPETVRLAAWVTGDVDVDVVRASAAELLPAYMVPAVITAIDAVPLTPNGKVDAAALPEPAGTAGSRQPQTDAERAVCSIVGEVLGVDDVGLDDDFFALGGHSLLAVSLMGRLRDELGIVLPPLRAVFESPTPAALLRAAGAADEAPLDAAAGAAPALRAWAAEHPRRDDEPLPLSPNQARLWFLNRLEPTSAEYSVVLQAALEGELDTAALRGAVDDLVERHEVLRTTYPEVDGRPVQQIHEPSAGIAGDAPIDLTRGFDLASELPVRAALIATGEDAWRLELVIHHIATDGASLAPLVRDLATAYAARAGGATRLQRPLEVQYADWARMQASLGAGGTSDHAAGLAAWVDELAGIPTELELPVDGRRPDTAARRAGRVRFTVPAATAHALHAAASGRRASGFHAWLAALAGFLQRVGAGDDIVIGSPSAGRGDPDLAELVGFFVNTLPLRVRLDDAPSLFDAVDRARDVTLRAIEHESVPFERIVEAMAPERRLGRHPLFQTMLTVEEPAGVELSLPGVTATRLEPDATGAAKLDLSFTLRPQPSGEVEGVLEHDAALLSERAAHGLVERWLSFLDAASAEPHRAVRDVPLEPSVGRLPRVGGHAEPEPESVLEALAVSLAARPDSTTLTAGEHALDGAALDARIEAIAAGITAAGVVPGAVVALRLPRSTDTVAGLLAVWRVGAVVAPIDAELPLERVATMLRTAGARLVLHADDEGDDVTAAAADRAGIDAARVMRIDALPAPARDDALRSAQSLDAPAYLIFTSGTTGEPKAVQVPHRALATLLASHRATLMPDAAERRVRMAHTTGVGFDAAMDPILWLAAGHELHIVDDATRRDPDALVALLEDAGIGAWETTPSYVAALAGQTRLAAVLDERPADEPFTMLLGGEPLDTGLWTWLRERSAIDAWNLYGPTEVGVDSLVARVAEWEAPVLGATTGATVGYVLDAALRPAPVGSVGELWLAGAQLAHGYLGRAAATAERFVADPFAADGSRMYRTGDLVVVRDADDAAPAIVSLGRGDDQTKIRGHRVEPGEVEAVLRSAAGVAQAVVRPIGTARGAALGAWIVPAQGTDGEALVDELGALLRERLPDYMVPAAIGVIDAVPLTPNGKVDARALPELRAGGGEGRAAAPGAEAAIAAAFAEVLGVADVRADDSFFALGGHSFVAQPTIRAINDALGSELPVQALFQAPTVAGLAALVDSGGADVAESLRTILPLRREGSGDPVFAVHPASGVAWKFTTFVSRLDTQRPILGVQMPGIAPDEPEPALAATLDELLEAYVEAIRAEQPHGPYTIAGYSFGGRLAHHIAARLQAAGERVALLAILDDYPSQEPALAGVEDEQAMWRRFLDANGARPPQGALDVGRVRETLDAAGSPLADVPEETIERMVRRFRQLGALLDAAPTPVVEGGLHVFASTERVPAGRPGPEAWEAFATGAVTSSPVGARHQDVLGERGMDDIAPVLSRLLRDAPEIVAPNRSAEGSEALMTRSVDDAEPVEDAR